jgi:hypothetical protein
VVIKKSPHVRLPRIRLEWQQPETDETNIRNQTIVATVPENIRNIEMINLESGQK